MNKSLRWALISFTAFVFSNSWAQTHKGISFQGVIKLPSGVYPTRSGLTVNARILSPNDCILREESFSGVNVSNGYINIAIGTGAVGSYDPGFSMKQVMDNSKVVGSLTCINSDGTLSSGSFNPAVTTGARKFRLSLYIDSIPVVADFNMRAMAYAVNAESLNGKTETDFVNTSSNITQSSVESWFASAVMGQLLAGTYVASSAATANNVSGVVAIANGGTGAATASGALANLLPSQTGNSGKVLTTNGSGVSWTAITSPVTSVAGRTGDVVVASTDLADFNTAADARITAQKGVANGLATLNASGKVPSSQLALTAADVPNLDASKITSGTIDPSLLPSSAKIWQNGSAGAIYYNGGNIGVGTAAPQTVVDIYGLPIITGANRAVAGFADTSSMAADVGGGIRFIGQYTAAGSSAEWAGIKSGKTNATDGDYGSYMSFMTRTNGSPTAERMRIDNNGNVGIGTMIPGAKLEIAGQVKITGGAPGANKVLTSDASGLATWEPLPAGNAGTVTSVSSANNYVTVANGTNAPVITAVVGTSANTLAAGDDSRFTNSRTPTGTAGGDLLGTYPNPSVVKIQGKDVTPAAYAAGQVLRYDGASSWINALLGFSDLSGTVATSQLPTIPVSKGGTGVTSISPNRLLASDGTGSTIVPFTCPIGNLVTFDAAGVMGCTTYSSTGIFANGGNSFSSNATLGTNDNYDLNLETNGSTRMTIANSGNVGIGTSTPMSKLHVMNNLRVESSVGTAGALMQLQNSSTNFYIGIENSVGGSNMPGTSPYSAYIINGMAHDMHFGTSGAVNMTINSAGNVGIGTTTPTSPLNVIGNLVGTQTIVQNVMSTNINSTANSYINTTGYFKYTDSSTANTESNQVIRAEYTRAVGATGQPTSFDAQITVANANINDDAPYILKGLNVESPIVANGKNLNTWQGIAITGPSGTGTISNKYALVTDSSAGNVGIGTKTPSAALEVAQDGNISDIIQSTRYSTNSSWGSSLVFKRAQGTKASPAAVANGNTLGGIYGSGAYDGTGFFSGNTASIRFNASENWSPTTQGTNIDFSTTQNGTTNRAVVMTIADNGRVHIGPSVGPAEGLLHLTSSDVGYVGGIILENTTSNYKFSISSRNDDGNGARFAIADETNNIERLSIDASGKIGMGTPQPAYKLDVLGDIHASGNVIAGSTTLTSDIRFKRNIASIENPLEKILSLRGVTYDWRRDEFPDRHFTDKHQMGVIAQEVEAQFPEAVLTDKDGYKSVNYSSLVAPLIETVKELYNKYLVHDRKIEKLEADNAQLHKDNAAMKKALCRLGENEFCGQ